MDVIVVLRRVVPVLPRRLEGGLLRLVHLHLCSIVIREESIDLLTSLVVDSVRVDTIHSQDAGFNSFVLLL